MKMKAEAIEDRLSSWMKTSFVEIFELDAADEDWSVAPIKNMKFGDYQCNSAMELAKTLGKTPQQIAEKFVASAVPPDYVEKVEAAGAGFINFTLSNAVLADYLAALESDPQIGATRVGEGKTVVIDYSSPNVAKAMHIGHIRSTVIGNSIDRIHRFLGYRVIADNHLGDWGTQFGLIMLGYRSYVDEAAFERAPAEEMERVYVKSYKRAKEDPKWREDAKSELVKLQQGDPGARMLWGRLVDISMKEFNTIYSRLGVEFDLCRGESFYHDRLPKIIERLEKAKIAVESEGALVVDLKEEGMPIFIVKKSDGGYNYATTDLATVESRIEEFRPDRIVYVTDDRQRLHFRQFFTVAEKMGMNVRLDHVWFGLMRLPEAAFSTRKGNVIQLGNLLDEAEKRALEMVRAGSPEIDEAKQKDLAAVIGIGAVKYADLSQNPRSLVTFTWEKALNMEGNSAPYLQYAYARISSVRDKYTEQFPNRNPDLATIRIGHPIERRLAIELTRFGSAVKFACKHYRPNILADYLYDLARIYSSFYQNVPFLKAEEGIRESRIRLCGMTARILKQGLMLLGIETRERI